MTICFLSVCCMAQKTEKMFGVKPLTTYKKTMSSLTKQFGEPVRSEETNVIYEGLRWGGIGWSEVQFNFDSIAGKSCLNEYFLKRGCASLTEAERLCDQLCTKLKGTYQVSRLTNDKTGLYATIGQKTQKDATVMKLRIIQMPIRHSRDRRKPQGSPYYVVLQYGPFVQQ